MAISTSRARRETTGKETKVREIVKVPDPVLHKISLPVTNIDGYIRELAGEMEAHLSATAQITRLGLAAVQLGELVRIIVVMWNLYSPDFRQPVIIINPEMVPKSPKMVESQEGCLSIGDGTTLYTVKRFKLVKVTGLNIDGQRVVYKERGLPGYALQHEIDHLNGRLISDY